MKKLLSIVTAGLLGVGIMGAMAGCDGDTIKVGVTNYKPMDYLDASGKWVGFDAELAEKTFQELGYKVEFVEIDWETKIVSLNAKSIDVIWNGMTVTQELKDNVLLSEVYLQNQQYGVVKAENQDQYNSKDSLAGKKVAVENGSAAEDAMDGISCTLNAMGTQNAAVMEVASGQSDVAVVDYTMARTLTSEGSDYYGTLVMVDLGFEAEEFAIGFRKADTKLCTSVNGLLATYRTDGTIAQLAKKYGIENLLPAVE